MTARTRCRWVELLYGRRFPLALSRAVYWSYVRPAMLVMANSVRWHDHVLRREDVRVLRRAIDFDVEGKGRNGGRKGHGNSVLWKKV